MKKYYQLAVCTTILFFSLGYKSNAQADSVKAEQLKTKLIGQVCDCVSKSDTASIKTGSDAQNLIMKCFMGDGLSTFMDYVNASGVNISDMTAVQALGQKVGMELVIKCPALITIMMNMAKDTTEVKKMINSEKQ